MAAHPRLPFPREEEGSSPFCSAGASRIGDSWEAKAREGKVEGKEDPHRSPDPAGAGMQETAIACAKAGLSDMAGVQLPGPPTASPSPKGLCEEERETCGNDAELFDVWL